MSGNTYQFPDVEILRTNLQAIGFWEISQDMTSVTSLFIHILSGKEMNSKEIADLWIWSRDQILLSFIEPNVNVEKRSRALDPYVGLVFAAVIPNLTVLGEVILLYAEQKQSV